MRNVLDRLPQREQSEAKELLRTVVYASTRAEALKARQAFGKRYGPWYLKAVTVLEDDWDRMVTFYDFPEAHWKHLRTTNVVESPFASVRPAGLGCSISATRPTPRLRRASTVAQAFCTTSMYATVSPSSLTAADAGLIILDVGNGVAGGSPTSPVLVGRVQTAGGHAHNAWYWPAAGYVFVGEESSRPGVVHVVDVSDLSNPVEVATFGISGETPHNFWLDEAREILYVAWYSRGLRAIDVGGELFGPLETQGREVGRIEYSDSILSWAPQLHDGLVYVSDVNSGLWILRPEF